MLNRTNRTLSASFDRLNLGTRSLAVLAGNVNVADTLRSAFTHPHSKRMAFMRGGEKGTIGIGKPIPGYPWSPSSPSSPGVAESLCSVRRWVGVVAEHPPVEQEVVTTVPAWPTGRSTCRPQPRRQDRARGQSRAKAAAAAVGRATPARLAATCAAGG
jgi:hypothetical protein